MSHTRAWALWGFLWGVFGGASCVSLTSAFEDGSETVGSCEVKLGETALSRAGLSHTSIFLPDTEVQRQLARYGGPLCPDRALGLAVRAILEDDSDEALAQVGAEVGNHACSAHCYLDRRSSLLGLVAGMGARREDHLLPPFPGEAPAERYWTFFVSVPDLSEHGYWARVARDGSSVDVVSRN